MEYTVSTQESTDGLFTYPDIWVHTTRLNGSTLSTSYILGIGMSFDATFSLPGKNLTFNIEGQGDPGSEEIEAGQFKVYNVMCERCTERFSEKIAAEFGI